MRQVISKDDYDDFVRSPLGKAIAEELQEEINVLRNKVHLAAEGWIAEENRDSINRLATSLHTLQAFQNAFVDGAFGFIKIGE